MVHRLRALLAMLTGRDELRRLTALLGRLSDSDRRDVRAALWLANQRSRGYWAAGLLLLLLPLAGLGAVAWALGRMTAPPAAYFAVAAVLGLASTAPGVVALRSIVGRHLGAALRARHVCTGCGYDLRATPARCPECGLAPAGCGAADAPDA